MRRATTAFAIVLLCLVFASPAQAIPCWVIKQAVAAYGEDVARAWAKAHGYSVKEIAEAAKCLRK